MARIVAEGIDAGALGFSFSRTKAHTYRDGGQPGTLSSADELVPIATAIAEVGGATIMFSPRGLTGNFPDERQGVLDLAEGLANASHGPVMMCLIQVGQDSGEWASMLEKMAEVRLGGAEVLAQCTGRSICTLGGFSTKFNPFAHGPSCWHPDDARAVSTRRRHVRRPGNSGMFAKAPPFTCTAAG